MYVCVCMLARGLLLIGGWCQVSYLLSVNNIKKDQYESSVCWTSLQNTIMSSSLLTTCFLFQQPVLCTAPSCLTEARTEGWWWWLIMHRQLGPPCCQPDRFKAPIRAKSAPWAEPSRAAQKWQLFASLSLFLVQNMLCGDGWSISEILLR